MSLRAPQGSLDLLHEHFAMSTSCLVDDLDSENGYYSALLNIIIIITIVVITIIIIITVVVVITVYYYHQ